MKVSFVDEGREQPSTGTRVCNDRNFQKVKWRQGNQRTRFATIDQLRDSWEAPSLRGVARLAAAVHVSSQINSRTSSLGITV